MQDRSSGGSDRADRHHSSADGSPGSRPTKRRDEIEAAIDAVLTEALDEQRTPHEPGRQPLDNKHTSTPDIDAKLPGRRRDNAVSREYSWVNYAILIGVFVAGLAAMALVGRAYTMGYVP